MRVNYKIFSKIMRSSLEARSSNHFLKTDLQFSRLHNKAAVQRLFSDLPKVKAENNDVESSKISVSQEGTKSNQESSTKNQASNEQGDNSRYDSYGKSESTGYYLFDKASKHSFGILTFIVVGTPFLYFIKKHYEAVDNEKHKQERFTYAINSLQSSLYNANEALIAQTEIEIDEILLHAAEASIKKDMQAVSIKDSEIEYFISTIENYAYLKDIISVDSLPQTYDGKSVYKAAMKIKTSIEKYLVLKDPQFRAVINGINKNPSNKEYHNSLYIKLGNYGTLLPLYIKALHTLGRTYFYMDKNKVGSAEKYKEYFELAKSLGEKGGFFEAHLSQSNGLLILQKEEAENLFKEGRENEAILLFKQIINSYAERMQDTRKYSEFRFNQEPITIVPAENARCKTDCLYYQVRCYLYLINLEPTEVNLKGLSSLIKKAEFDRLEARKISTLLNLVGNIILDKKTVLLELNVASDLTTFLDQVKRLERELELNDIAYDIFHLSSTLVDDRQYQKADAHGGMVRALKLKTAKKIGPVAIKDLNKRISDHKAEEDKINAMLGRRRAILHLSQADEVDSKESSLPPHGTVSAHEKQDGGFWREYYQEAVDILLPLRVTTSDVRISKSLILNEAYKNNQSKNSVNDKDLISVDKITDEINIIIKGNSRYKSLMPIIHNAVCGLSHWVGLVFEKSGHALRVMYVDPENKPIPTELEQALVDAIATVENINDFVSSTTSIDLVQRVVEEQVYSNNCGPELLENFIYCLTGTRSAQEGTRYLHSLLLENSLLDPVAYQLKIAENLQLISLLSNTAPMPIEQMPISHEGSFPVITFRTTANAIDFPSVDSNSKEHILPGLFNNLLAKLNLDFELKKALYSSEVKQFNKMLKTYGVKTPDGLEASINLLRHRSAFKKSLLLKLHPDKGGRKEDFIFAKELEEKFYQPLNIEEQVHSKLQAIQPLIHKTNLGFKSLDVMVDLARIVYEPTAYNLSKAVLNTAHLYSMNYGINGFSTVISTASLLQQAYQGYYSQAFITATIYMVLPFGVARINNPYLTFVHSITMLGYIGYSAITNTYSFCFGNDPDFELRSTVAYKNLFSTLSQTPLQRLYDFTVHTKKYELQINDMLLEKEKLAVQIQLAEKGEFGQKIFDYIYMPALTEKYALLNDITRGAITIEEAEALKTRHVSITSSDKNYDHCMEIKDIGNIHSADLKRYYCYNDEQQLLEHILVGYDNYFEVLERL